MHGRFNDGWSAAPFNSQPASPRQQQFDPLKSMAAPKWQGNNAPTSSSPSLAGISTSTIIQHGPSCSLPCALCTMASRALPSSETEHFAANTS